MTGEVEVQIVVQARMGSTRLPGKVLLELGGRPIIGQVVRRAKAVSRADRVVVATSENPEDDAIFQWCNEEQVPCCRGSANDVLGRFLKTLREWPSRQIVRLTADCPLHDPGMLDALIDLHLTGGFDYSSNLHPPTFPHGLDAEILSRETLETAGRESTAPSHREHVTLFVRETPARFRIGNLKFGRDASSFRLTIDRSEDYRFLKAFMSRVADPDSIPGLYEILRILERYPELAEINGCLNRYEWKDKIQETEGRNVKTGVS